MGVVYRARQTRLGRVVALKMILAGSHAGPEDLARFRIEAQAVARLSHPNIVQIHEVGEQDGRPFFSLEFCPGGSLASKLDGTPLPPERAAELVETVARAVQAAHDKGIVHRDLKPANVLLAEDGTPRITDFGLAKKLDEAVGQTQSGSILGTPSYMAPEQAGGKSKEIGPPADVYALGAILYELLTGRPPFKAATPLDTILQVVSEEPVPPRRLQPKVPRDLETICLKCLHKEQTKRYASARHLAEDLRHFRAGEPIQARPTPAWERALKWARRRPALAAAAAVSLAAAVGLVAGGLWYNAQLSFERDAAASARDDAEEQRDEAERQRVVATQAEAAARRHAYAAQVLLAQQAWEVGQTRRTLELLQGLRPRAPDETDLRAFEWGYLDRLCHSDRFTYRGHNGACLEAAFSPEGTRVASVGMAVRDATGKLIRGARVKVWEPATGREVLTCTGHTADIASVAFSRDGRWLASGGGLAVAPMKLGEVKLFRADTGKLVHSLGGHSHMVNSVVFSRDSRRLASAGIDSVIRLWDVETGKELRQLKGHKGPIRRLAFSPDGQRLASAGFDQTARLWDVESGKPLHTLRGHGALVFGVAFHPKGRLLASAGFDKLIRVWDVDTGKEVRVIPGSRGWIATVAYSPDGRRLAAGGGDPLVRVWDADTGQEVGPFRGRDAGVNTLAYSPDGNSLAAAGSDGAVTVWETAARRGMQTLDGATSLTFGAGGRFVAGYKDGRVRVWKRAPAGSGRTFTSHTREVNSVAISRDGRWLASGADDATARLRDLETGKERHVLRGHKGDVLVVAFSPDSRRLVSAGKDGTARVWDVASGQLLHTLRGSHRVNGAAFTPDGRLLATCGLTNPIISLWGPESGRQVRTLEGHSAGVVGVALSPDGRRLASGSLDGTLKVWDTASGRLVLNLRSREGHVGGVAFSPDGQRLAAGVGQFNSGKESKLQLWDAVTGQELLELPASGDILVQAAFSPDGQRLAAATTRIGGSGKAVLVWDGTRPAVPDTSQWKVVFRDDFKRGELAERWVTQPNWAVQDGRLRGTLKQEVYFKISVANATITPKLKLPGSVEVRFDCSTSEDMNVHAMFSSKDASQGLQAWLLGVPAHMTTRGAAIVWQGGPLHFPVLAANPHVDFQPKRRYQVRVLREPRRLTMFVNGVEAVSARVPLLETEDLSLGGMFGKLGSEVYLANVEVRVPGGK
jgi:WD40 repeat protein